MVLASKEKIRLYEIMLKIRLFEEKVSEVFRQNLIPGFIHLYVGEEAVAAGVCATLRQDDYVVSTHRGHGHCIAKGADFNKLMAELFGKDTGYCRGRAGTMHIFVPEIGFLGTNGIVGGGLPLAVGAGLKAKMKKTEQVSVCFFGDGASNNGTFHESLNLAAIWKLPVIFVCENNLYATAISVSKSTSVKDIASRAASYNIPGIVVDGTDVLKVYEVADKAVTRARQGAGPTLIECKTYRFHGHYEGESCAEYRSREEVENWKNRDSLKKMKKVLLAEKILDENKIDGLEHQIMTKVEEAVTFASQSLLPKGEDALDYA